MISDEYPPFTFVGIDYIGPVFVCNGSDSSKGWICLFTCLNVRAIHLEFIDDMTTESFLMCFRRFVSRRGCPMLVISDNAPQFKLGSALIFRLWHNMIRSENIQSYVAEKGIQWKFIIEYSPWKGGFYERLVALTKSSHFTVPRTYGCKTFS